MNADELTELIKKGPTQTLVSALAGLSEAERRKLSKSVVSLRKQFSGELPLPVQQGDQAQRLRLALMGVGPWGEVRRIRVWHIRSSWKPQDAESEHLFQVIRDRKSDWLRKWAEAELDERHLVDWSFVRRLVRAGLCERPQTENYILQMFGGLNFLRKNPEGSAARRSRTSQLGNLATVRASSCPRGTIILDSKPSHPNSWSGALRDLSAEGKLDRQRLLSASLSALLRNLEARNTSWFVGFHEVLEPNDEERQALQTEIPSIAQPSGSEGGGLCFGCAGSTRKSQATRLRRVPRLRSRLSFVVRRNATLGGIADSRPHRDDLAGL